MFLKGRDGDHLMCPFECDLCVFHKLKKRDPNSNSEADKVLLAYIRRANLDAFWSRASSTVTGNKDKAKQVLESSEFFGLDGPFIHQGPLPSHDHCGYEIALGMLFRSTRRGRNVKTHLQYDTMRSFPTVLGNQLRSSPQACSHSLGLLEAKGNCRRFVDDPCSSLWFHRFKEGC